MTADLTLPQWAAMVREWQEAHLARASMIDVGPDALPKDVLAAADKRADGLYNALLDARPRRPEVLAAQLRWLWRQTKDGQSENDDEVMDSIIVQLETMAAPPA